MQRERGATMKAAYGFALVLVITTVAAVAWRQLSPSGIEPPGVTDIYDVIAGLHVEDCWRKQPATDETVCNYKNDEDQTHSVRFRSGKVIELVRGRKLGGRNTPFNQRVKGP